MEQRFSKKTTQAGLYQNQTLGINAGSRFWPSLCPCSFYLALFLIATQTVVLADSESLDHPNRPAATSQLSTPTLDTQSVDPQWRLTRYGWQSKHDWLEKHTQPLEPWAIHPLLWAPALVLLLLSAMIWTTEEWDFDQMFPAAAGTGKC